MAVKSIYLKVLVITAILVLSLFNTRRETNWSFLIGWFRQDVAFILLDDDLNGLFRRKKIEMSNSDSDSENFNPVTKTYSASSQIRQERVAALESRRAQLIGFRRCVNSGLMERFMTSQQQLDEFRAINIEHLNNSINLELNFVLDQLSVYNNY